MGGLSGNLFLNPPYGRELKLWVKKASETQLKYDQFLVILIPSRTDTSYWHDYIFNHAEIKFRAWSKDLSEYRKLDDFSNDQGLGMLFEVEKGIGSNITSICYSIGDVVEQFTGLKDVNGKDIYEGDIVKAWSDYSELTMEPTVNEIVSEDLFGRPGVFLKPAGPHLFEPCLHDSRNNQFEVIGNFHANPELLED